MALIKADLSRLSPAVRQQMQKILTDENADAMIAAHRRQKETAKAYTDHRPNAIEGLGEQTFAIDPYWQTYFKMKYGEKVMDDPEFKTWLKKNEAMFRVRSNGTRIQSGYGGHTAHGERTGVAERDRRRLKFHKNYG